MATRWYHNAKTGEIASYQVSGELTDFPRGTWLAYQDYITTNFETQAAAKQWAVEWFACPKCKRVVKGPICCWCGTVLPAAR